VTFQVHLEHVKMSIFVDHSRVDNTGQK
jgi:hypothetical protein